MTRFILALIFALFCLGNSAWADEVKESDCIEIVSGSTLWGIAKARNTSVQALVTTYGFKNPNKIYPGTKCSDAKVKNPAQGLESSQAEQSTKPIVSGGRTESADTKGYTPYAEVNRNPLVSREKRSPSVVSQVEKDALFYIGVNDVELSLIKKTLSEGKGEAVSLSSGTKFISVSEAGHGKSTVKITYNRVATWKTPEKAVVITFPDGRKVARLEGCFNWVVLQSDVKEKEASEDIAIAAVTPEPEKKSEEEEGCGFDDHELFLSRGGTSGNGSRTTYNYADGFVCLVKARVDGGTVKGGVVGLYGSHKGSADDGFGYKGKRHGLGPAVKYVDDDGWDARFGLLFGGVSNDGHSVDGDYVQSRNFRMFGPSAGINLYQREIAGEKWFPKTQIWASAFKLSGASLNHSWQGTPIGDAGSLKSSWLISAGVRQFLYQGPIKPWVSAEYFAELPMTRNGTLMIGVTDEDEILWAGIGRTWNLKGGGSARSWMIGLDVGNLARKLRSDSRHEEWVNTNTSYYDSETGAFTLKKPGTEGKEVATSSVARFDIASGRFVKNDTLSSERVATGSPKAEPARLVAQTVPQPQQGDRWASAWGNK